MKKNETIDILIPAFNVEKYIGECLDSLLKQTYKDFRIVVVDDGSKDKTFEILTEYAKAHDSIKVFQKENEKSVSKTRNYLLSKIESPYFTFVDSDDYVEPEYLEVLYKTLKDYDVDMSICNKVRHKEKNKKIDNPKKKYAVTIMNQHEALAEMISSKLFNGSLYCKLFRTELLKDSKFNPEIHYGEDLDFCFKVMQNCKTFAYVPRNLYHYIVRKNSIVTAKFKPSKVTCVDCYDNIINMVKDDEELYTCAKSMQGMISIEILYYTWRDHYKDKELKNRLKTNIKDSMKYVKKNKRLPFILKCSRLVWWLTKFM
ncbi:MAG: glycosyltransferase family 2 protein [Clostridia bacterium]|nr:glycosyltransferase family 2 protein [Clostridia bacterium]